jgi:oxygen-independent coproporphyrinogen-3 oxidase
VPVDEYLTALERELTLRRSLDTAALDTLYLGGGTPSRLGGSGVAHLIDLIRRYAALEADAEVTVEANPEDVSVDSARAWRAAGVNRVSLGVQSFDDAVLRWMHRVHDADRARRAVGELREAGIENVSLDLIFALPAKVARSWERDVGEALALAPQHVSLYGLTIEERTPLGRSHARGEVAGAPDERYEKDYLHAHRALADAGLEHYEVSNFARAGARSRHNSAYWRHVPYAGLGPGAHELIVRSAEGGKPGRERRWNDPAYASWTARLGRGEDPVAGSEVLTAENEVAEQVYLGLRTRDGLRLHESERGIGAKWVAEGWATLSADPVGGPAVLGLTPLGWLRLDALAASLTNVRSP